MLSATGSYRFSGISFTVQELLDGYPLDDLLPDVFAAYIAVQKGATKVFKEFPLPPIAMPKPTKRKTTTD